MTSIKVLGMGCANCQKLEGLALKAVSDLGIKANVEKVTDVQEIMSYNVLSTPGLVVDGQLVSSGRLPSLEEIRTWLVEADAAASES